MANINAGPVSLFKVPFYAADGSVPSEGDVLYRGLNGLPTWGSAALVARSLESKADLTAIQAMATISRAKVYYAIDTGKQYMWTGGGSTGAWEVAEVNSGLALGETLTTAYRGDRGKVAYDTSLSHASRHQHGGPDEIATATPAPNVVIKADNTGRLPAGFLPQATEIIAHLLAGGYLFSNNLDGGLPDTDFESQTEGGSPVDDQIDIINGGAYNG